MVIIIIADYLLLKLTGHPLISTIKILSILEVFMLASNQRAVLHELLYCDHLI